MEAVFSRVVYKLGAMMWRTSKHIYEAVGAKQRPLQKAVLPAWMYISAGNAKLDFYSNHLKQMLLPNRF